MTQDILIAFFASLALVMVKHTIPYLLRLLGLKHDPPLIKSFVIIGVEWVILFFITFILFFWAPFLDESYIALAIILLLFLPAITSFEFFFRPLFLSFQSNLKEEEKLSQWLKTTYDISIKIYCYKGELVNAYATGAVPFSNTIILGENLIENLSEKSLKTIILHETGHLVKNHLFYMYLLNVLCMALFACILMGLFSIDITPEFLKVLLGAVIAAITGGFIFGFLPQILKTKSEHQADLFAAEHMSAKSLEDTLTELDVLSEGRVSKGGHGYPTLKERVRYVESLLKNSSA